MTILEIRVRVTRRSAAGSPEDVGVPCPGGKGPADWDGGDLYDFLTAAWAAGCRATGQWDTAGRLTGRMHAPALILDDPDDPATTRVWLATEDLGVELALTDLTVEAKDEGVARWRRSGRLVSARG